MNRALAIRELRKRGWKIQEEPGQAFQLPPAIAARYPKLPGSLVKFLSGLTVCEDKSQTTWFLCQPDFAGTSGGAFRWDEWEQLSFEAAREDASYIAEVRAFWDRHFPFLFSVHSGYAYHAVCSAGDRFGQIVEGSEPLFEEVSVVAGSFDEFLGRFCAGKRSSG